MERIKQNFKQDEVVIVSRLGDGWAYRARIKGLANEGVPDFYIVEWVDFPPLSKWTHSVIIETCIDRT
jgi:hypothetical protein